jgi:hypothetical protein
LPGEPGIGKTALSQHLPRGEQDVEGRRDVRLFRRAQTGRGLRRRAAPRDSRIAFLENAPATHIAALISVTGNECEVPRMSLRAYMRARQYYRDEKASLIRDLRP